MFKFEKKHTYFGRVITLLLLFVFLMCVPYVIIIYNTTQKKVLGTIQASNDQSLKQIKYNYTSFNETMSNVCMSVYLDNEIQTMLYNNWITYNESNKKMVDIKSTILPIYPSIYSISVYNGGRKELYSTLTNKPDYNSDLTELLEDMEEIPRLQPVLRRIPHAGTENYIYVFSYFIYDYMDSANKPSSYVVLDENASWLINSFQNMSHINQEVPSRLYLVDGNDIICSTTDIPEADQKLLEKKSLEQIKNNSDSSYYTEQISGKEYLITTLRLNEWGGSLVMIQDYDDVFEDFISLHNTFRLIVGIWVITCIVAVGVVSKSLYHPVNKLMNFINETSGSTKISARDNEFNQFMKLYKDSHEKLVEKDEAKQYFMRRYQFEKLLTDESEAVWESFCAYYPEHWLVTEKEYTLRVLYLTLQLEGKEISEDEYNLFLFVTQNILSELLEKEYQSEIFQSSDNKIYGIIQASAGNSDMLLENILRETQGYLKKCTEVTFSAAYSDNISTPIALSTCYKQTEELMKYNFVYGEDAIINSQICEKNLNNEKTTYPENLEKKLMAAIYCGDGKTAQQLIEEIFENIGMMRYENIQISVMTLANHLNFTLKELYQVKGALAKVQFQQIYHGIVDSDFLDMIEAKFKEYISSSLNMLNQKNESDKGQDFVKSVQKYIDENFKDPNLSSQSVGDYLGLTGKYVMKKFQDGTGSSLNDYIYMVRMRHAAMLLKNSSLPVSKISEQVGILNENYFYKLFKKAYGCTPREYSNQNKEV